MTKRAYKYHFYPTPEQEQLLARTFGCVRFVYNAVLRYRTDAFHERPSSLGGPTIRELKFAPTNPAGDA